MTRLNSGLAGLLVALVAAVVALSVLPVRAQNRSGTPADSPVLGSVEWEVLGVLERNVTTGVLRLLPLVTPTPDAPSLSPTATPSATPSSTATLTPTATPSATAAVSPEPPTPTPETVEPPPTFTLTPVPKSCALKNGARVINIRSAPTTAANNIVNKWQPGAEAAFTEFRTAEGYLWGRMAQGWLVVRSGDEWWTYGTEGSDLCADVAGWPVGLEPPAPIVAAPPRNPIGLHMIWGTDTRAVLDDFLVPLAAAGLCPTSMKALDLVEYIIPQIKRICPQTRVIYRTIICGDHPRWDQSPEVAAEQFYNCARGRWLLSGADVYEVINESPAPIAWKARFSLRVLELGTRDGLSLIVPGDGPGNPEVADYANEYAKLYAYILAHPGAGHAISTHAYGIDRYLSDSGPWLGFRHRLFYEAMRGQVADAARVPVYLTEIGPYGAFRNDPITCTGLANDMARYAVELRRDPYVRGAHLFTTGSGGGEWYAVDGCLAAIADALKRVL